MHCACPKTMRKKVAATPGRSPRASDLRPLAWTLLLSSPTLDSSIHFTLPLFNSPTLLFPPIWQHCLFPHKKRFLRFLRSWNLSVIVDDLVSKKNRNNIDNKLSQLSSNNTFLLHFTLFHKHFCCLEMDHPHPDPFIFDMNLLLFEQFVLFKTKIRIYNKLSRERTPFHILTN